VIIGLLGERRIIFFGCRMKGFGSYIDETPLF
jgi:hypothetical protein